MHFEVDHQVRITPERYFEIILSEDFQRWLKGRWEQDAREIVSSEERGGIIYRTIRSERVLGEKAQKYMKVPRLIVDDIQEICPAENRWNWKYVPNVGAKRFSASGTGRIEAEGDHLRRCIEGEITVRMALFGKRIESKVVDWVQNNMTKVGDLLEEYDRTRATS